jgi:hypothetical protein
MKQLVVQSCKLEGDDCTVCGIYEVGLLLHKIETVKRGKWKVQFKRDPEFEAWNITSVEIRGIRF